MKLVPYSLFEVIRQRKLLNKMFQLRDWSAVRRLDESLQVCLDKASKDNDCDRYALLKELEVIVSLYRDMAQVCHHQGIQLRNFPMG